MAALSSTWSSTATWSMSSLRQALPTSSSYAVQRPTRHFPSQRLRISLPETNPIPSFLGLAPLNPILSFTSLGNIHLFPTFSLSENLFYYAAASLCVCALLRFLNWLSELFIVVTFVAIHAALLPCAE